MKSNFEIHWHQPNGGRIVREVHDYAELFVELKRMFEEEGASQVIVKEAVVERIIK